MRLLQVRLMELWVLRIIASFHEVVEIMEQAHVIVDLFVGI